MSVFAEQFNVGSHVMVILADVEHPVMSTNPPEVTVFKTVSLFEARSLGYDVLAILHKNGWDITDMANRVKEYAERV